MGDGNVREVRALVDILETFEARTAPFSPHEVADAVRSVSREWEAGGKAIPIEMRAEWLAFTFIEDYREGKGFDWGTYYGPMAVAVDANGKRIELPSVAEVTPEVLVYWAKRAQSARHPVLRIRYADLVWEFGRRENQTGDPKLPRIVIDATLVSAKGKLFADWHEGFTRLKRALDLALSLRDNDRVLSVRDAMIVYEGEVSEDSQPGTWGWGFDMFVENKPKNVSVPPEMTARLVSDLEARLDRLARPKGSGSFPDPFAVEAAALGLARHYRNLADSANMRRVLMIYGQAFRVAADQASAMLAMAWLERVLDVYRTFGLKKEAEAIEVRLRDLGPDAMKEMKPVSTSVQVPAEEFERFLDELTAGSLQDVLNRIAAQFVPNKANLTEQVHRLAKVAPLISLLTQKITDEEGRPVAAIGSIEKDLDGHLVRQASQNMQFEAPWLRAAVDRMLERLKPTAETLRDHLLESPIFDRDKAPILERGLIAYLAGEAIVAAPVLIPQIEDALRNMVRLTGASTYKPHRRGGVVLKNFDDLLREEAIAKTLGDSVVHYFQVLFADQRGWNIRNDVCHGITPLGAFSWQITDRIFHTLLILATLRSSEAESSGS